MEEVSYNLYTSAPFEVVRSQDRRSRLMSLLGNGHSDLNLLFSDSDSEFEAALEEMEKLQSEGKLYRRWRQVVDGKERALSTPSPPLNRFMNTFVVPIIRRMPVHPSCHGGEKNWSAQSSVRTHLPCTTVLSFDLRSAFPLCNFERVFDLFHKLLGESHEEDRKDFAGFFASLATVPYPEHQRRGLSQGSSYSMPLFNRIFRPLDESLYREAQQRACKYTRWVDDITISSPDSLSPEALIGAVAHAQDYAQVSPTKVFHQQAPNTIYVIGQVIEDGRVFKNSRKEVQERKSPHLNWEEWFGNSPKRDYQKW